MASPIMSAVAFVVTAAKTATAAVSAKVVALGAKVGLSKAVSLTIAKTAAFLAASKLMSGTKARLQSTGSQLSFVADPNAPIPIILGRTATAGTIVFQYPSGPKNKHLNMFPVLSGCGPVEAIEGFQMNTVPITFNTATGKPTNGTRYQDRVWLKTALGVLGAAAIVQPSQPASDSALPEWGVNHKLSGYAHAWLDTEYDSGVYNTGLQPLFILRGVKCYDPRKDSTYPGGSGAHRSGNPATWEISYNPAIYALTYAIGWTHNGKRVGGVGVPVSMIDVAAFVEAANVADANSWTVGGRITTADSKWQTLNVILQAGGAEVVRTGALLSCRVNAPRVALATITRDDLSGGGRIPATKPRRDRVNSIIPKYRSEAHGWEIVSANPVTVADYVTLDGGLRQRGVDYSLVQDARQAAQLAAYDIVNGREVGPITLPLKPKWLGFKPGDAVTVNIPERGLNNQLCIITTRQPDFSTGDVTLTLETETTAKHDFALGRTASPPPTTGLTIPDFATVPAPESDNWSIAPETLTGGGASVPAIALTGDTSDNVFASEIVVDYRKVGDADWTMWGSAPNTAGRVVIAGLAGSTDYQVGVRYKTVYGVTGTTRLVLGPVTTPAGFGVAASIVNQGTLATRDNVVFNSPTLLETPAGAQATLANFKTGLGTAAAILNQGSLAVLNSLDRSGGYLTGFGDLSGLGSLYFGSPYFLEAFGGAIATLSAFKTSLGVASSIANQGALAVLSAVGYSQITAGFGGNLLPAMEPAIEVPSAFAEPGWNPDGITRNFGWAPGQGLGDDWSLQPHFSTWSVRQTAGATEGTGTGYCDTYVKCQRRANGLFDTRIPVQPGQYYEFSAYTGAHRCKVQLMIQFYDLSGAGVGGVAGDVNDAEAAGGQTIDGYKRLRAYGQAPAGAAFALPYYRKYHTKPGNSDSWMMIVRSMFCRAVAGQTEATPYSPPANATGATYYDGATINGLKPQEAGANVTEARTAAAIYGQTAWATFTATTNRVSRLQDDGYVESGTIYRAGVGSLTSYWPQEGGANVTEARTAAAVYGQGALATLNSLDLTGGRLTGFGYFAAFNQITLNSSYLKRADGSTEVTESLVVTNIGVAAAISNQGSLAVQSYVNPGQFRESDTYTLPLRTTAWQSGRIDFIDNSYDYSYTDAAGEIGFVYQLTYWHNYGAVGLDQKVRSGDVPFVIIGNGVVDEYLSAWYEIIRNSDGAILTGTTWISDARESGSGTGGVGFGRVMVINIPVGSRINFYLSVKKSDRNPNSGDRSIRTGTLTVAAINA